VAYVIGRRAMGSFFPNGDTFETKLSNPLESTEDKAEKDKLLDDATIEIEGLEPQVFRP